MAHTPPAPEPAAAERLAAGRPAEDSATDERALVARAASDAEAFAALYRRYVEPIYQFAYRRSGSREVAEDVTSATFEKALRSLDGFHWERGGFRAWLYRIASNEVADHHRRLQRDSTPTAQRVLQRLGHDISGAEGDTNDVRGHPLEGLEQALAAINPRYQQALSLRYLAGLTAEETAAALGCSRATLAVVLHRAAKALRRQLAADAARDA